VQLILWFRARHSDNAPSRVLRATHVFGIRTNIITVQNSSYLFHTNRSTYLPTYTVINEVFRIRFDIVIRRIHRTTFLTHVIFFSRRLTGIGSVFKTIYDIDRVKSRTITPKTVCFTEKVGKMKRPRVRSARFDGDLRFFVANTAKNLRKRVSCLSPRFPHLPPYPPTNSAWGGRRAARVRVLERLAG